MSIEALKQELASLDVKDWPRIIAYLVEINQRENQALRAEMTRKIDDKDPSDWLTLEEFDKRLSLREDERSE
jgi:hypothetical protein